MGASPITSRSRLLPVMLPWLAAAFADVYVVQSGWPRPPWGQCLGEVAFFALAGRVQWGLARGWARSALLPAAVVVFYAALLYAPRPWHQLIPFLLGLGIGLAAIVRFIASCWCVPTAVGVVVAVLTIFTSHYIDVAALERPEMATPHSLLEGLALPRWAVASVQASSTGAPVVVISVDTLRADAAAEMETVRRLAARGAYWERAMSTSSWTLPALASLQTGQMPADHGAGCLPGGHCQGIFPGARTLAEELRESGYATCAVVGNAWIARGTGFDRGFDRFIEPGGTLYRLVTGLPLSGAQRRDGHHIVDAAIEWLDAAPKRGFYLWVHVMDPHLPYLQAAEGPLHSLTADVLRNSVPLSAEERHLMRAGYTAEVTYTDRQLLRLVDALARHGILDTGVVVFTADHGEEFWDHGGVEHGHSHHGEITDVPLILVAPGVTPGMRQGVASLVDVASTIRAALGRPADGIDLRAGVPPGRIALAWGNSVTRMECSARDARRRVIVEGCADPDQAESVYDLVSDPRELQPMPSDANDPVVLAARSVQAPRPGEAARIDRKALRALGYVQ